MSMYLKIIILLLAAFTMRPTVFGQAYTAFSLVFCLAAFFIFVLEKMKSNMSVGVVTRKNFYVLLMIFVSWLYLLSHAWIMGSSNVEAALNATIIQLVTITIFALILSSEKENYIFFKWFIKLLVFFSFSYVVTVFLSFFIDIRTLFLFELPIEGRTYHTHNFYFPLSSTLGSFTVNGITLPRFLGFFREPGILQAFLIWALFNLKQYDLDNIKNKLLLLLGIIGTFSTTAIVVLIGTLAVKYIINKKVFRGFAIIGISILALIYVPYVGIADKVTTHEESINARSTATVNGLVNLMDNPFGTGLYDVGINDVELSGINLLAASSKIGIIGLVLVLMVYILPMLGYQAKKNYLIGITPILITLLYAQPIFDSPLIYALLMANYTYTPIEADEKSRSNIPKLFRFKRYKLVWK